jgi:hypothetical protein
MLQIIRFVDILPLIRCLEEGLTVIHMKMSVVKLHHSIQSYLALLNHEQSLIHSLDIARQNNDERVACLSSMLSVALVQIRRRIPILKSDLSFLLDQCQSCEVRHLPRSSFSDHLLSLQKSLRQYSCQNHSLGYELEVAGYPALAKDKFVLSERERSICDKISVLLRLGQVELTIESPDFVSLQSIFEDDNSEGAGQGERVETREPNQILKEQYEDLDCEAEKDHQIKRPRFSSGAWSIISMSSPHELRQTTTRTLPLKENGLLKHQTTKKTIPPHHSLRNLLFLLNNESRMVTTRQSLVH